MKIYFSCAITGGRADQPVYQLICDALTASGCQVLTAHLAHADVMTYETSVAPEAVFQRDSAWVEACDALVAEVSTPSHGVGYEIALALCLNKPTLCLYRQGRPVSKMLLGNTHPRISVRSYRSDDDVHHSLLVFLSEARRLGTLSSQSGDYLP